MLRQGRIAVVSDHELLLNDVCTLVSEISGGFETSPFASAYPLLEGLDRDKGYDLIILDITANAINGLALVATIRNRGVRSPVIVVSDGTDAVFQDNLIELDITAFVRKSATIEEKREAISKALSRSLFKVEERC